MSGSDRERREMVLRAVAMHTRRRASLRSARRAAAMRAAASLRFAAAAGQRNAESS